MMIFRRYVRIIVEEKHDQWSAWFAILPQCCAGGGHPAEAIDELLEMFANMFEQDEISSSDPGTRDGHLEFLIPFAEWRRIPRTSMN